MPSVASNPKKSSARFDGSSNQSNSNITQSNKNVKSDIFTKYSIQESENNSGSFNLQENHKQQQLEIIKKQIAPTDKIDNQSVNRFVEQPVSNNNNTIKP